MLKNSEGRHQILLGIDLYHLDCDPVHYNGGQLIDGQFLNEKAHQELMSDDEITLKFRWPEKQFDEKFMVRLQKDPELKTSITEMKDNYYVKQRLMRSAKKFRELLNNTKQAMEDHSVQFIYSYEHFPKPGTLY